MTSLPLPFGRPKAAAVASLLPAVLGYLHARGWVSARQLAVQFATTDRMIRAVAAASQGQIISGQKGYCDISVASVSDANHAASWLEHQADEMKRRAFAIRQAMHRRSA